jgi:hypothetical protein
LPAPSCAIAAAIAQERRQPAGRAADEDHVPRNLLLVDHDGPGVSPSLPIQRDEEGYIDLDDLAQRARLSRRELAPLPTRLAAARRSDRTGAEGAAPADGTDQPC